jgi:hypothetical protein
LELWLASGYRGIHKSYMHIWLVVEGGCCGGEELPRGVELGMDFDAHSQFPTFDHLVFSFSLYLSPISLQLCRFIFHSFPEGPYRAA